MIRIRSLVIVIVLSELTGPKGQVVSDQLHDGGRVFVLVLWEILDVGNSIIEGLLGHLTGFGGLVHDLVVEHGEVEGETKSDGVSFL